MKVVTIKKITVALILTFAALVVMSPGSLVRAIGEGQIEGGDIYRIKNVTKNTAFSDPNSADQCETVQYKVRLHNPGPGVVTNVNIKVDLPSTASTTNVSTATVTAQNAQPATRSDTATLNLSSSKKVNYINGSTELLNTSNAVIGGLPDGITTGGINVGSVGVSINEIRFVQFKAKVDCDTPSPPVYSCDMLNLVTEDNRTVRITAFNTSANNGAVFKNADINWGDNSTPLTSANVVGQTHQYAQDGTYTITATARFTVNGQDVTASGPNCAKQITIKTQQNAPVFTCDKLEIKADKNRKVTITAFDTTAKNGAVYKFVEINWGDSNGPSSTPGTIVNPVGQSHQYAQDKDATYTIVATAHFTVDGKDVTDSGVECAKQITFKGKQPPVITTPPSIPGQPGTPGSPGAPGSSPAALVNTGPGSSIAGLFAAVVVVAGMAHRFYLSWRLNSAE